MKFSKKMILVPPEEQINPVSNVIPDILEDSIFRLDNKMKNILNNLSLSNEEKVKQYSNALDEYLLCIDKYKDTKQIERNTTRNIEEDEETTIPTDIIRETLSNTLPKTLIKKGEIILKFIENHPNYSLSEKGEIIKEGKTIPNSNIVDLIHHKLRKRKKLTPPPHGYSHFHQLLYDVNVPTEILQSGNVNIPSFPSSKKIDISYLPRKKKRLTSPKKITKSKKNGWDQY